MKKSRQKVGEKNEIKFSLSGVSGRGPWGVAGSCLLAVLVIYWSSGAYTHLLGIDTLSISDCSPRFRNLQDLAPFLSQVTLERAHDDPAAAPVAGTGNRFGSGENIKRQSKCDGIRQLLF
ncbi:hypothetical protein IP76_22345 [Rhizobium sp. AAP43]|nr:hypothetical protein IP76_22345 [Rhizobium sp. AAP43]